MPCQPQVQTVMLQARKSAGCDDPDRLVPPEVEFSRLLYIHRRDADVVAIRSSA
jgi:hypothetical protein